VGDESVAIITQHLNAPPVAPSWHNPEVPAGLDALILRLLEKSLRAEGYAVETARDGREAEQKLKGQPPDLVVLDAMLPHVHGFELCSRIKGDARLRNVPVLMMSAVYRGWRFAQDAREAFGADDYIEKPFHLADVLRRVHAGLEMPHGISAEQKEAAERAYKEGVEDLSHGRPEEARGALELAAKTDPFSARNHFALGRALRETGAARRGERHRDVPTHVLVGILHPLPQSGQRGVGIRDRRARAGGE